MWRRTIGFTLANGPAAPSIAPRASVLARAVPERPGEPSPIQHVVYIIRENRTYDQVLGDIGKGASDPSLVMYGRDVTPNTHALAEQFVLLDHFFASGGNSADGHNWLTQANETDYPDVAAVLRAQLPERRERPARRTRRAVSSGRRRRPEGKRVVSLRRVRAGAQRFDSPAVRAKLMAEYRDSTPARRHFRARTRAACTTRAARSPRSTRCSCASIRDGRRSVPDVVKADVILEHLREWERAQADAAPHDHDPAERPHAGHVGRLVHARRRASPTTTSRSGKIVEALSHSSFWKSMAILVVEDDAQNGVDHIDGHRTVALVASPYARRGVIDSTFYSQPSMVKTIELMLGLPALVNVRSRGHRHARQLHRAHREARLHAVHRARAQTVALRHQRARRARSPDPMRRRAAPLRSPARA